MINKRKRLKVGLIGAGTMGRYHARAICALPGAKLEAVSDIDRDRVESLATEFKTRIFSNFKEMLSLVDAVVIASPTDSHYAIAQECLSAGKSLLVEKPLAKTSTQANALVDLSKSKNLILAVGLIERFNPAFQELCKVIRKEKIIGIHARRFSPFPDRITDTNVIQDMMIHDLDLLLNLLAKDEIESIKAEGRKVKSKMLDIASATICFNSGIIAKVESDRSFGIKTRKFTVVTERGLIEADLLNKRIYVRNLEHHIPSIHHTKNYDQLRAELADFVKAVKIGARPKVDGSDGYRALKLVEEVESACS
jgi:virulence factor